MFFFFDDDGLISKRYLSIVLSFLTATFSASHVYFECLLLSGAEIRSVCTEAGMLAIRERRKLATEKDFLNGVHQVIKALAKFSATPRYMTYN